MTIETEECVLLPPGTQEHANTAWCPSCRQYVRMLTPEQAAPLGGVSPRTIYRWIEANAVHFHEQKGCVLICLRSLPVRTAGAAAGAGAQTRIEGGRK